MKVLMWILHTLANNVQVFKGNLVLLNSFISWLSRLYITYNISFDEKLVFSGKAKFFLILEMF